jgi:FAD-linked sulfhydryl oxidase
MDSGCPLNRRELGRATWAFLHTTAAYYPEQPDERTQNDMRKMIETVGRLYPCGYCADTTSEEIRRNPPDTSSQKAFSYWVCELHNEVNDRLNKPTFDCSRNNERWRDGYSDGRCD